MCGERTGAVVLWLPSHHPSGCCTLVVVEERPPPHMTVKRFGCTTIHNKALYKCLIHSFIWANRSLDLITIGSVIYCNAFFLSCQNKRGRLVTYSDGNIRWKFLFGSFIPRRRLESVILKYSKHPHRCGDWQPHIHLKTLDSSALNTGHASKIIPQVTAIPGFQTEMATKRQNLRTAALRSYF